MTVRTRARAFIHFSIARIMMVPFLRHSYILGDSNRLKNALGLLFNFIERLAADGNIARCKNVDCVCTD